MVTEGQVPYDSLAERASLQADNRVMEQQLVLEDPPDRATVLRVGESQRNLKYLSATVHDSAAVDKSVAAR